MWIAAAGVKAGVTDLRRRQPKVWRRFSSRATPMIVPGN
jgi:hypothetical protein